MAVYYKFKSAKDYDSIPIDGHFISVATLKEKIYESKQLGRGTDYDLVVSNAQNNEEYLDEAMLIPKNTSVLIRRLPGRPRMPIVTAPVTDQDESKVESESENIQSSKSSFLGADPSVPNYPFDLEYDEFGNDLYEIPEAAQAPSSNHVQDAPPPSKADEDSKIRALIDTPALDWQRQTAVGFGPGRGFGRGMGGRMGGRGFGRGGGGGGLERKTMPPGYVCYRCNKPGHFIQHCPTNGDPTFDVKRVKPPTGIPKSMLIATPDGSYALPSGAVAVLKPNEAAFEKEIEGMPSTRHVGELPPELHCPLCKQVMKDAVLTSKCCFESFCDKCIRDQIISKSVCVCGATNVLADDLLPNKTLRDTINRILESNNDSAENGGSAFQVQDMESARCPPPKIPSPSLSATSKGEKAPAQHEEFTNVQEKETVDHDKTPEAQQHIIEKGKNTKIPDVSEATHDSRSMMEPAASQGSIRPDEEVQQKPAPAEAPKKKKKKKNQLPMSAEMQWRASQDLAAENYMMPMGGMQQPFNPYWNGMHTGMEAFGGPFNCGAMPFMGYGLGPLDIPFGGMPPPDPFGGPGGYMMPPAFPPQRDLAEFAMGMNGGMNGMNYGGPPMMSREEFEARKAELRRKKEFERQRMNGGGRELIKDREFGREREMSSSMDISSMKSKHKSIPPPSRVDNDDYHHRRRSERLSPDRRSRDPEPPRPSSKRKSTDRRHDDYEFDDSHHHRHQHHSHRRSESLVAIKPPPPPPSEPQKSATVSSSAAADLKSKASVFSRISFPEGEAKSKKQKLTSSSSEAGAGGGSSHHRDNKAALSNGYHEEHHKSSSSATARKSSTVIAAAAAVAAMDVDYESSDDDRHFKRRAAKERERDRGREDRDRSTYNKHR